MHLRTPLALLASSVIYSAPASNPKLDRAFDETVRPYIAKYCAGCHGGNSAAAQFDLKSYTTMDLVTRDYPRWALVMERLTAKEIPPKPVPPPPAEATQKVIDWIHAVRAEEI